MISIDPRLARSCSRLPLVFAAVFSFGLALAGLATAGGPEEADRGGDSAISEVSQVPGVAVAPETLARLAAAPVRQLMVPFTREAEPNDTFGAATPLGVTPAGVRADLYRAPFTAPTVDVDFYSFTAAAGDRVYAATMTAFSGGSSDTLLDILAPDGTTVIETDDDDGAFGTLSSNIAGTVLPIAGTYFVRVRQFTLTSLGGTIRPYDLYVHVLSGVPTPETEPNNNGAPQAMSANRWMSGTIDPAADTDTYVVAANAGDTIVAIVDVDPERDAPDWNARVGVGLFNNNILLANGSVAGDASPSEAIFMTVNTTGAHQILVDEAAAGGAANFTYHLSVFVIPGESSRTYTSYAGTGGAITDMGVTDFTLNIPDARTIGNLRLTLSETHAAGATGDLDVSLISPDGNEVVVFDDPLTNATATAPQINLTLDDEAAIPTGFFAVHSGMRFAPENYARLAYFKGMQSQGTWTLRIRDDTTGNLGTLNAWSLSVGEDPAPSVCGVAETIVHATDFETDDAGYTHSGTADEWARGLPSGLSAPITSAHSGVNAFKTDLIGGYNASSNQDLLSPNINLVTIPAGDRITVSWWQKSQMETANLDSAWVEVREVGNPTNFLKLWEWKGATQTRGVGNPVTPVTVQVSAGWGLMTHDISAFAGLNVELRFHLDSGATGQFSGLAIDDPSVRVCANGNLTITPTEADFFDQLVGSTSAPFTVTLGNSGTASLMVTTLDTANAPFTRSGGSCSATPITIAAAGSCTLEYTFSPTTTGGANQTLTVTANAPGSGGIALSGNGIQGNLTITPPSAPFGDQLVGSTSAPLTVTLGNSGTASLMVTTLDTANAPFTRSGGSCSATPITIAAAGSCTLEYTFSPTATGAANQTLTVTANAPGSGTIALSGNGTQGNLTITPDVVLFGNVEVASTSALGTTTLGNNGTGVLTVNTLTVANSPFVRTNDGTCGNTLTFNIAAGSDCTLTYRFTPTAVGSAQQTITVGANATGETVFTLDGTGTPRPNAIFANGFEG